MFTITILPSRVTQSVLRALTIAGLLLLPLSLFAQTPAGTASGAPQGPSDKRETPDQRFAHMDKNHDGFITQDEVRNPEHFKNLLARADNAPKDGKISKEEFMNARPPHGGQHGGPHGRQHDKSGPAASGSQPGTPGPGASGPADEPTKQDKRFTRMDKNHDGFVTSDEARDPDRFKRLLEHADNAPKDGKISKEEFMKAGPPPGGPHGPASETSPNEPATQSSPQPTSPHP